MAMTDICVGVGLGAALMFIADPRSGRRRRALARDQLVRASRKTRDALDATATDVANRTTGIVAATRGRLSNEDVDDARLMERVRAKLGRACSHPHAIEVGVLAGSVTLRGPILADEVDGVLAVARSVRGVRSVTNALEMHDSTDGVPALQGTGSIADSSVDILQRNWAPATQALVAAAGIVASAICVAAYTRR